MKTRKHQAGKLRNLVKALLVGPTVLTALLFQCAFGDPIPKVVIPPQRLPHPNAYDYFRKASNQINHEPAGFWNIFETVRTGSGDAPLSTQDAELLRAGLEIDAPALKTLRTGFLYPYEKPRATTGNPAMGATASFPVIAKYRDLARVLSMQVYSDQLQHTSGAALEDSLDSVQIGVMTPGGGGDIDLLVGIAVESIGIKTAWREVPELNALDAKRGAKRTEQLIDRETPFKDIEREEGYNSELFLLYVMHDPNWRNSGALARALSPLPDSTDTAALIRSSGSNSEIMKSIQDYIKRAETYSSAPYTTKALPPADPKDPAAAQFANSMLLPQIRFLYLKEDAQLKLLATALALRAYYEDHGLFPGTLSSLTPRYLNRLPLDPFSPGHQVRYIKSGPGYILYSVGPDGIDDHGKAIYNPTANFLGNDLRYSVQRTSKGDIVAGVNTF